MRLDPIADLQRAKDWVNQTYSEVAVELEVLQDVDTMTLTASQYLYVLDSAISRIKQMYVTPTGQGQSRPLVPTSVEQLLEWSSANGNSTANQGSVTHYAMVGLTDIQFFPTPRAADVVTLTYVKIPDALVATTDVPIFQEPYNSSCLIEGACYKAAMFLQNPDAVLYKQNYDAAVARFRGHLRRREGSMTRQFRMTRGSMVIPSDPSIDIRY